MSLAQNTTLWYAQNGFWQRRDRPNHTAGAVIPGYYLPSNANIASDVSTYNMNVKGHTAYVSWAQGSSAFPQSAWLDTACRGGLVANYVWEPVVYGALPSAQYPSPNATFTFEGSTQVYGWTQVTSGSLDQMLHDVATAVAALPYNINIQIPSERDTYHQNGGTINGVSYTWAALDLLSVSAISYIINFFKNTMGVTNATFSAGIGGWNEASFDRCYCPDVDIIQFNAYNYGSWQTAAAVFSRTYNWLSDLPSGSQSKPVWLAEWGCTADSRRPAWFLTVPPVIASLPRIEYMSYFNAGEGLIGSDPPSYQSLASCYSGPLFGGIG